MSLDGDSLHFSGDVAELFADVAGSDSVDARPSDGEGMTWTLDASAIPEVAPSFDGDAGSGDGDSPGASVEDVDEAFLPFVRRLRFVACDVSSAAGSGDAGPEEDSEGSGDEETVFGAVTTVASASSLW